MQHIHRPIRLQLTPYPGPSVGNVTHPSAHPSVMHHLPRPIRLHLTPYLGPSVSNLHSTSAHPSVMPHIPRPIRLHCTLYLGPPACNATHPSAHPSPLYTVPRPTRLQCNSFLGPPISILYSTSAQPYQCYTLPRPIRLHCFLHSLPIVYSSTTFLYYIPPAHPFLSGTTTLGPPISNTSHISAHPSPFYPIPGPIRLHHTLYPLFITTVTLNILLYSIPLAHPFPSGTHHTLGPLLYDATIITLGPCRMARPTGYIVTLGWLSETGEFTEWALTPFCFVRREGTG